jgi:hypothetical protein
MIQANPAASFEPYRRRLCEQTGLTSGSRNAREAAWNCEKERYS